MQDDVYEDEIEFDDPPIVEEIPSDELDNVAVASSPTSIKACRGKALHWEEHVSLRNCDIISYPTLEDVEEDVKNCNYSKMCSSVPYMQYRCRIKKCNFKRKYRYSNFYVGYISYFSGDHDHSGDELLEIEHGPIQRGLEEEQKSIIKDAFRAKLQSSGDIINYFRHRRKVNEEGESPVNFPADPNMSKLNNFIATYKKSNACVYNPSLSDLVSWCEAHGPETVDERSKESFNTPFVLDYFLVNLLCHVYFKKANFCSC